MRATFVLPSQYACIDFEDGGKKEHLYTIDQDEIDKIVCTAPEWLTIGNKHRLQYNKIQICPYMCWSYVVCNNCHNISVDQHTKKKTKVKMCCMSPYCTNPGCIKARINFHKNYLFSLGIKAEKLIHLAVGFPLIKEHDKKTRSSQVKTLKKFLSVLEALDGMHRAIVIIDFSKKEDGQKYAHFHIAVLPVKNTTEFHRSLEVARKTTQACLGVEFSVESFGYHNTEYIFNYFAKRLSGVFGHNDQGGEYGFADFMTAKEYFKNHYKRQRLWLIDLHRPRMRAGVLSLFLNGNPRKCHICGHDQFHFVPKPIFKPPPYKTCVECGQKYAPEDYDYQLRVCKYCKIHNSFEHRKAKELRSRLPEVAELYQREAHQKVTKMIIQGL